MGDSSSTDRVSLLTRPQKGLLKGLSSQVAGEIGQGAEIFGGQTVAGTPTSLQTGFDQIAGFGEPAGAFGQTSLKTLNQGSNTLQDLMKSFDPQATTNFFNQSVAAPAIRNFQRNIVPGISERFAGKNALKSGAFGQSLATAGADLTSDLSAQLGALLFNTENATNDRRLSATQTAGHQALLPQQILSALFGSGGVERGIEQEGLTDDQRRFDQTQPFANPALQFLGTILGTQAFQPVVTQTEGAGSVIGPAAGAFLGSEAGAGALTTMMAKSDRRLKENITYTGDMIGGVPEAEWDWTFGAEQLYGLSGKGKGVIAQDDQTDRPDVVLMDENKYLMVDYALLKGETDARSDNKQSTESVRRTG